MAGSVIKTKTRLGHDWAVWTTSGNQYRIASVEGCGRAPARFLAFGHDGREWIRLGSFRLAREANAAAESHGLGMANLIDVCDAMRAGKVAVNDRPGLRQG